MKYASRQLPSATINRAPALIAMASSRLCCDNPTALMRVYWRRAAHCWNSIGRAARPTMWKSAAKKRARNRPRKLKANP